VALDFQAWPSIPRLNRQMLVTEKIDGTNAAVIIESHGAVRDTQADAYIDAHHSGPWSAFVVRPAVLGETPSGEDIPWEGMVEVFEVGAQSRKRLIHPGDDNFGFAKWVWEKRENLVRALDAGRHFGEWWGSGIQRGYGLAKGEKRFSLFNVSRYSPKPISEMMQGNSGFEYAFTGYHLPEMATVPLIYAGPFSQDKVRDLIDELNQYGSFAVPNPRFPKPEGVVVYHTAANQPFKVLCENDELPKSLVGVA
jgi:hypothetical protein